MEDFTLKEETKENLSNIFERTFGMTEEEFNALSEEKQQALKKKVYKKKAKELGVKHCTYEEIQATNKKKANKAMKKAGCKYLGDGRAK